MNDQLHFDSLAEADLDNQRVIVRTDLDAPQDDDGNILDTSRIEAAVPTIRALLDAGARVLVTSRFGEFGKAPGSAPEGEDAPSLEPAASKLAELLGVEVLLPDSCTGDSVRRVVQRMRDKQVCVLENLCKEGDAGAPREALARRLMNFADVFVADSLRALSMESATTTVLPRLLPTRLAGPRLLAELSAAERVRARTDSPRLVVFGAPDLEARLPLLRGLIAEGDEVFFTGVAANTMLAGLGGKIGRSKHEGGYLAGARTLAEQLGRRMLLPTDFIAAKGARSGAPLTVGARDVPDDLMALDLGPSSRAALAEAVSRAGNIVWLGTLGVHQVPEYRAGTRALVEAIAAADVFTLAAGDDSVAAARTSAPEHLGSIDCVSSGGEATLALLNGNKLPGLEALWTQKT